MLEVDGVTREGAAETLWQLDGDGNTFILFRNIDLCSYLSLYSNPTPFFLLKYIFLFRTTQKTRILSYVDHNL